MKRTPSVEQQGKLIAVRNATSYAPPASELAKRKAKLTRSPDGTLLLLFPNTAAARAAFDAMFAEGALGVDALPDSTVFTGGGLADLG